MNTKTTIERDGRFYVVSTVLLKNLHAWLSTPRPYETMVFRSTADGQITDWDDLYARNYNSAEEATVGHETTVKNFQENTDV